MKNDDLTVRPKPGLRERNKIEKRRRIKEAARLVFRKHGYRGATTREIAEAADVAMGTLFNYARDKRELLFMIINDELDEATRLGLANVTVRQKDGLIDQLDALYRPRYECLARDPDLGRHFALEIFFVMSDPGSLGPEGGRNRGRRKQLVAEIANIIRTDQANGKIEPSIPSDEAAYLIHTIYLSASRQWLEHGTPDVEDGVAQLRKQLGLAIRGLLPGN